LILAIAMIASFSAVPAMADLDLGGSYRAVGTYNDPGNNAEESKWVDQRMRVGFTWAVNDNVTAQLRGDFAEFAWGDGYRPDVGRDTLMVDRAFVTIKQGPLTLSVGQQANAWGLGLLWSDQFQGIHADLDFAPFNVKALWSKESEGGAAGNTLTDDNANDDRDIYGVQVGYVADAFTAALTYVTSIDKAIGDDARINGYSGTVTSSLSGINLGAELAFFDGDNGLNGATKADYEGTQVYVYANTAFTEQFKAGLSVIWADDSGDDIQVTSISDDTGFNIFDYAGALGYDNGIMNLGNTPTEALFDIGENDTGVLGAILDASFAATETITFYGKLLYAEPSDDQANGLDSAFGAIANVDYAWMPAVTLSSGVQYIKPSIDNAVGDEEDAIVQFVVRLGVTF
jgi:hypothetical protein